MAEFVDGGDLVYRVNVVVGEAFLLDNMGDSDGDGQVHQVEAGAISFQRQLAAEGHVLVKTAGNVNGTMMEGDIASITTEVQSTDSVTSTLKSLEENTFQAGGTRARWVGVIFAVVLAIVGTGLVVSLTLREKEYETTLLRVRGFTRGQVLKVLLAEIMVMIIFFG